MDTIISGFRKEVHVDNIPNSETETTLQESDRNEDVNYYTGFDELCNQLNLKFKQ